MQVILLTTLILLLKVEWVSTLSELGTTSTFWIPVVLAEDKSQWSLKVQKNIHKIDQLLFYLLHSEYSFGHE